MSNEWEMPEHEAEKKRRFEETKEFFSKHENVIHAFASKYELQIDKFTRGSLTWDLRARHPKGGWFTIFIGLRLGISGSWSIDVFETYSSYSKDKHFTDFFSVKWLEKALQEILSWKVEDLVVWKYEGYHKDSWKNFKSKEEFDRAKRLWPQNYPKGYEPEGGTQSLTKPVDKSVEWEKDYYRAATEKRNLDFGDPAQGQKYLAAIQQYFTDHAEEIETFSAKYGLRLEKFTRGSTTWELKARHPLGGWFAIYIGLFDMEKVHITGNWFLNVLEKYSAYRKVKVFVNSPMETVDLKGSLEKALEEMMGWKVDELAVVIREGYYKDEWLKFKSEQELEDSFSEWPQDYPKGCEPWVKQKGGK